MCVLEQANGNSKTSISSISGTFPGSSTTSNLFKSFKLLLTMMDTSEINVMMLTSVNTIALAL